MAGQTSDNQVFFASLCYRPVPSDRGALGQASRGGHTRIVWWIAWVALVWVALSVPLAILIGKAIRQKDLRELPAREDTTRKNDPPDRTVA